METIKYLLLLYLSIGIVWAVLVFLCVAYLKKVSRLSDRIQASLWMLVCWPVVVSLSVLAFRDEKTRKSMKKEDGVHE